MNRDPTGWDCTRDPIYLLQIANRQWTQIPDGLETDGESWYVSDKSDLEDWILPFIEWDKDDPECGYLSMSEEIYKEAEDMTNDHGWPLVYTEWRTESVFLTRGEGEEYAKARSYRWDKWRVYCVCCEGTLAKILNEVIQ